MELKNTYFIGLLRRTVEELTKKRLMHLESIKHNKSAQTITGTFLDQCGLLLFLYRDTCTLCVSVCVCVCEHLSE